MKNINNLPLLSFLLISEFIFGQGGCPAYTHTDPNPLYVQPSSEGFKTNTFDWTGTNNTDHSIPINKPTPITESTIISPYFSPDLYMAGIALHINSDNKPEDGWELIKQDMGYYYNASSTPPWDGTAFGDNNKTVGYIVLYNKYQAVMRVFAVLPSQDGSYGVTVVNLSFFNAQGVLNAPVSALFNSYNQTQQTLDQTTNVISASAMAIAPSTTTEWIYADFPIAYDPCTCFFESDLEVSFETMTTSTLTADGVSLGTAIPVADVESSSIGANGVKGQNPFTDNYITSFIGSNNATPTSLVQDFQNAQSLANQWTASSGTSTNWGSLFSNIFNLGSNIAQTVGAAMDDGKGHIANAIGFGLASAGNIANFFSNSNENASSFPLVISSQLALQGTISTSTAQNGTEFIIANPGNPNAASEPEYGQQTVSPSTPSYPMYNQTMGLFALLTPPNVNMFFKNTLSEFNDDVNGITVTHEYQFANNFQYAFNPIVDATSTKIWASLEIESFPASGNFTGTETGLGGSTSAVVNFNSDIQTNLTSIGTTTDGHNILRTPFLPVECQSGIVASDALPEIVLNQGTDQTNYEAIVNGCGLNVTLQLMIVYVFNPDEYGVTHTSTQILTYPVTLVTQTSDLTAPSGFQSFSPFPTNLSVPATTFTSGGEIFSYGTITITGNLTNTSGSTENITASQGIIVSPGVIVGPNIILQIEPGPIAYCNQSPIAPTTVDNTYCNSSSYKANELTSPSPRRGITASNFQDAFSLNLYPNPTRDKCSIVFDLPQADNCTIALCDLTGRQIKIIDNSVHAKGNSTVTFNTAGLASGMYMVHFSDASNTTTRPLTITSN